GTKADSSTGNGDKSPALTTKTTFTLNCTAFDGTSASASTTVDVSVPPLSLSFTADSYNLSYGGGTTLHWTATNGNKCEKSGGGWGTSNANIGASSTYWTGGLTSSQSFSITCSGPGGTLSGSVNINVAPPPPPPPPPIQVYLCNNANFDGNGQQCYYGPYGVGYQCNWVGNCGVPNDTISSMVSNNGSTNVAFYWDIYYGGACANFSSNTGFVGNGWNDQMSSFKVGYSC
ncbi:MAG TPA: hypothetical protein VFP35_01435, partial [Candidatus Saccharimonadales bacterium]|nr:hypothetical protein [Candidatus Saccharimonadales bacterium]